MTWLFIGFVFTFILTFLLKPLIAWWNRRPGIPLDVIEQMEPAEIRDCLDRCAPGHPQPVQRPDGWYFYDLEWYGPYGTEKQSLLAVTYQVMRCQ